MTHKYATQEVSDDVPSSVKLDEGWNDTLGGRKPLQDVNGLLP